jgi:hypothetical protein
MTIHSGEIMKNIIIGLVVLSSISAFAATECKTFKLGAYTADRICADISYTNNGDLRISDISFGKDRIKSTKYSRSTICKLFVNSEATYKIFSEDIRKFKNNLDIETGERSLVLSNSNIVPYLHALTCK